jgi:hypothetical protein
MPLWKVQPYSVLRLLGTLLRVDCTSTGIRNAMAMDPQLPQAPYGMGGSTKIQRRRFDFKYPIEVVTDVMEQALATRHDAPASVQ